MSLISPISGRVVVSKLKKIGYEVVRQKGSHIRMMHPTDTARRPLTVPLHKTLKRGLLVRILKDAGLTPKIFRDI